MKTEEPDRSKMDKEKRDELLKDLKKRKIFYVSNRELIERLKEGK